MLPNATTAPFARIASTLALAWLSASTSAFAATQWSTDTSLNQVVSSAASDQNQPKVEPARDGGYWVSWLDGMATGFDVRLQRFDIQGNAVFPAGGILVADLSLSTTQDYWLDVALDGDAFLAFRDDRSGNVEITAARYSPSGVAEYGAAGITLTNNVGFVASPRITSNSNVTDTWVAWTEGRSVRIRSIDRFNVPTALDEILTPSAGSYTVADMHGTFQLAVFTLVHDTGGVPSERHLFIQSVSSSGLLWGTPVFTSGSLPIGALPKFTNAFGDSLLTWSSSSPSFQCFAQRIDNTGATRWQPGGVPVATTPGVRVDPVIAPADGNVFPVVTWCEQNASQSQSGISAQGFDRITGQRMWGDAGVSISPVGPQQASSPNVYSDRLALTSMVTWEESPSFGSDLIFGAVVDSAGTVTVPTFEIGSSPSGKSGLTGAMSTSKGILSAWSDNRSDGGDILVQQSANDGTPGEFEIVSSPTPCFAAPNSTGVPSTTFVTGSPSAQANDSTLWTVGLPYSVIGFFITGPVLGSGAIPPGSSGHVCVGGRIGRFLSNGGLMSSGVSGTFRLENDLTQHATPNGPITIQSGEQWFYQAWHRDHPIGSGPTSNFSQACSVTVSLTLETMPGVAGPDALVDVDEDGQHDADGWWRCEDSVPRRQHRPRRFFRHQRQRRQ